MNRAVFNIRLKISPGVVFAGIIETPLLEVWL